MGGGGGGEGRGGVGGRGGEGEWGRERRRGREGGGRGGVGGREEEKAHLFHSGDESFTNVIVEHVYLTKCVLPNEWFSV